jgi:hypothetical protein
MTFRHKIIIILIFSMIILVVCALTGIIPRRPIAPADQPFNVITPPETAPAVSFPTPTAEITVVVAHTQWVVVQIEEQAVCILGDQCYDLALFQGRHDPSQQLLAMCLDPDLDVPTSEVIYHLREDGIFVPPSPNWQRFQLLPPQ